MRRHGRDPRADGGRHPRHGSDRSPGDPAGPDELWPACVEYFEWTTNNPLFEAKAFAYEGAVTIAELPKMRAMTLAGLCMLLEIGEATWREWRKSRRDLAEVVARAEAVIRRQKFEGAAAGLLVPSIIARDLGLPDRQEMSGPDGGPIRVENAAATVRAYIEALAERRALTKDLAASGALKGSASGDVASSREKGAKAWPTLRDWQCAGCSIPLAHAPPAVLSPHYGA